VFYWTCKLKCAGAKIKTIESRDGKHTIEEHCLIPEHCHGPDPVSVEVKKRKEKRKIIARNSNQEKAIQIYQTAIFGTSKTVSTSVSKESVKQIIKRQQNLF